MRVYNRFGRRDNIYKARIKILVNDVGQEEFGKQVEVEWKSIKEGVLKLEQKDIDYAKSFFTPPTYDNHAADDNSFMEAKKSKKDFSNDGPVTALCIP